MKEFVTNKVEIILLTNNNATEKNLQELIINTFPYNTFYTYNISENEPKFERIDSQIAVRNIVKR